jgi:hypothetical protein
MNTTTRLIAITAALGFIGAPMAHAQGAAAPDTKLFGSISAGGQLQSHEFSQETTFTLFDEQGSVAANQTVDSGFVFDASVGYRLRNNFAVGIGFSTFNSSGEAAALASIPNALFGGKPTVVAFGPSDYGDLSQTTQSVNFMAMWMMPLTSRFDLTVFGGPSIIHVNQEMASVSTDSATAAADSQSGTTGKAGIAGVDVTYRLTGRYGIGGFIRYAGGSVSLDSVDDLTVGGVQAGGGIRFKF